MNQDIKYHCEVTRRATCSAIAPKEADDGATMVRRSPEARGSDAASVMIRAAVRFVREFRGGDDR